jgi:thiol-disulfide isomerase/thioredoxin
VCEDVKMRPFVLALCAALAVPAMAEEEVAVGLPAPAFSLRPLNPDVTGAGWLSLDKYAGEAPEDAGAKVVVLSFFASWCAPCKKEMPFLVQLDRMYREQGLRVVGVTIDTEEPGIATAKKMITDAKVGYPVLSDRFNFLARRYLGESAPLPSVFLIRRNGEIARIERGYSNDVGALLLASIQEELGLKIVRAPEPAKKGEARTKKAPGAKPGAAAEAKAEPSDEAKPARKPASASVEPKP